MTIDSMSKMKSKLIILMALCICMTMVFGCDQKRKSIDTSGNITPKVAKIITIYGSENCDHCIDFRRRVDSLGVEYTFKDAEANEEYYREMVLKVQQKNSKGDISFPVVEINDRIMVRPEMDAFLKELSR